MDVLSASLYDGTIAWYQNLGGGAFRSQHVIATAGGINFASSVYASDLDGDGDPDVLSAIGLDDAVVWYRNDGMGLFGVERVITTLANGSRASSPRIWTATATLTCSQLRHWTTRSLGMRIWARSTVMEMVFPMTTKLFSEPLWTATKMGRSISARSGLINRSISTKTVA